MSDSRPEIRDYLRSRPGLRAELAAQLDGESGQISKAIDDESLDHLTELNIVEESDGGYTITEPRELGELLEELSAGHGRVRDVLLGIHPTVQFSLLVAIALVVLVRLATFRDVYRAGRVVLASNDPYLYRYWVEQLALQSTGPFDLGVLANFPDLVTRNEPLMIATNWWFTELLGGTQTAAGHVLAWYPVVTAVITAVMVYLIAIRLSRDYRAGLAAVGLFAVTPGHAFRTALGFADHHAFDYVWLTLSLLSLLIILQNRDYSRQTGSAALGLGLGIAGQTLAWQAGPLLLVPLGIAVAIAAPFSVQTEHSRRTLLPITAGVGIGAALSLLAHWMLGWQPPIVAYAPGLVFLGCVGIVVVTEVAAKSNQPWLVTSALELVGAGLSVLLIPALLPGLSAGLLRGAGRLFGTAGIAETVSLVGAWGPIVSPVIMMGFVPLLGLPVTFWSVKHVMDTKRPEWLVLSIYIWYFFGLALVQRRFVGELAPAIAVAGGFGFVYLGWWLDLLRVPTIFDDGTVGRERTAPTTSVEFPERRRFLILSIIGIMIAGFSSLFSGVIQSRTTIDSRSYEAALWMSDYADERGWEHPDTYVLSEWGRNRMYNYFVNGDSRSYTFARENYGRFLFSSDPETWYEDLVDRTGFIAIDFFPSDLMASSMYSRLFERFGSGDGRLPGVSHYRGVYASEDGYTKVFTLVPGATLVGQGPPDTTVTFGTSVSIPGTEFRYTTQGITGSNGEVSVTVPYPGDYLVSVGDQEVSLTVPERSVDEGESIAFQLRDSS